MAVLPVVVLVDGLRIVVAVSDVILIVMAVAGEVVMDLIVLADVALLHTVSLSIILETRLYITITEKYKGGIYIMDMETMLKHVAKVQCDLEVDKRRKEEEKQNALAEKLNTNIDKFVESIEAFFDLWGMDELARLTKAGILQSLSTSSLKLDLNYSAVGWSAKAHLVMPEATIKDILDASKVILAIKRENELKTERYPDTQIFWYNSLREFSVYCKDYVYSFSVTDTDMSNPIVHVCKNEQ